MFLLLPKYLFWTNGVRMADRFSNKCVTRCRGSKATPFSKIGLSASTPSNSSLGNCFKSLLSLVHSGLEMSWPVRGTVVSAFENGRRSSTQRDRIFFIISGRPLVSASAVRPCKVPLISDAYLLKKFVETTMAVSEKLI